MEAHKLQKGEETATEVSVNDNAAAEARIRTEVYINSEKIYHDYRWYWVGRRTQDIILSLSALLVLWPIMLLIALIVWIDSPGASPIFTQTQVR